jgi:hypothetical protein
VCESNAVNTSSWQIEHACPQCGAPVVLEETDHLLVCGHCRVKLYLSSDRCFSYLLPPAASVSGEVFLAPYWRVKGMMFGCQGHEIGQKVIDASFQAGELKCLPISLGFRPQAMRLRFVLAKTPGRFLRAVLPLGQVRGVLQNNVLASEGDAAPATRLYQAFLGETVSTIYAPFILRDNILHDAILDRPVCSLNESGLEMLRSATPASEDRLHFVATLCPYCGWDLQGDKDSLVLVCNNCSSAWQAALAAMERVAVEVLPGGGAQSIHLPFWRIKAPLEGIALRTYADLVRLANLPKAIQAEWEDVDCHLWSPAFKVRPKAFLQIARAITLAQPQGSQPGVLPKGEIYPVTFAAGEALEAIKIILAQIAVAKSHVFPLLSQIRIGSPEITLTYLPFTAHPNEFIQEQFNFSIDRSTVQLGKKL